MNKNLPGFTADIQYSVGKRNNIGMQSVQTQKEDSVIMQVKRGSAIMGNVPLSLTTEDEAGCLIEAAACIAVCEGLTLGLGTAICVSACSVVYHRCRNPRT